VGGALHRRWPSSRPPRRRRREVVGEIAVAGDNREGRGGPCGRSRWLGNVVRGGRSWK
jgi:hypothetical protein